MANMLQILALAAAQEKRQLPHTTFIDSCARLIEKMPAVVEISEESASCQKRETDHVHEGLRVIGDAVTNYSSTFFSAGVSFFMIPVLLKYLGASNYGLLITASMIGTVLPVDWGLGWAVTKEIARTEGNDEECAHFVDSAGNLFMWAGILGGSIVAACGPWFAALHPDSLSPNTVKLVFVFAGVGFVGDHMMAYVLSVLQGRRKFAVVNMLVMGSVCLRAIGSLVFLRLGYSVSMISAWQAAVALVMAVGALTAILRNRRFLYWPLRFPSPDGWKKHLGFSLASQTTMLETNLIWQFTPLLIGFMAGPRSVVPYYVGQRVPLALSILNWKAGEPILPAASGQTRQRRTVLLSGMKWIIGLAVPVSILLWLLTPSLLEYWLGSYSPAAIIIMRLTLLAVLGDAILVAPLHFLLATGEHRSVLTITTSTLFSVVVLSVALLHWFGSIAAVWGLVIPVVVSAVVFLNAALRTCGITIRELFVSMSTLLWANFVFASILLVSIGWFGHRSIDSIKVAGGLASLGYVSVVVLAMTGDGRRAFKAGLVALVR